LSNLILGILWRPSATWAAIAAEPMTAGRLVSRYIVPLALVPSLAVATGILFFGADWDAMHGYALPKESALAIGFGDFVYIVATIPVLALILHRLAKFGRSSQTTYVDALKVATFGTAPFLLAGVFLVLPALVMLMIVAGMHSLYLINAGTKVVMRVSPGEAPMLVGVSMVALTLATMLLGGLAGALGLV
jgi:hypothetical protein